MLRFDFDNSVGCWIALTAQALRREMAAELQHEGITSRQWEVLAWIAVEGEMSQTELAERLGIEAPTMVGILDRMERDGWLERFSCPQDRRRKRMRITDKAESVWERMVACANRVRSRAVDGLSETEVLQLRSYCERIRQNLSEPAGDPRNLSESSSELITQAGCTN